MDRTRQMLIFCANGHRYAMDILHLREVGRMSRLDPEPDGPPGALGIARFHGQPMRVYELDPARLPTASEAESGGAVEPGMDGGASPDVDRPWLIITRFLSGDRCWKVDSVEDIVAVNEESVGRCQDAAMPQDRERFAGVVEIGGELTFVLTPAILGDRGAA